LQVIGFERVTAEGGAAPRNPLIFKELRNET